MEFVDDRTPEQKKELPYIVVMTDSFMSGWGAAQGGVSYAGWATDAGHVHAVESWVRSRSEARRVRIVSGDYHPKGRGHCHIYVAKPGIHYSQFA